MSAWDDVYTRVKAAASTGYTRYYFRGHSDGNWSLVPGLARLRRAYLDGMGLPAVEENLYFGFVTGAGELLPHENDSWANLFTMQHHGLPTRLLDWSESFAIALFFALREPARTPAVWVLNPFRLNEPTFEKLW